MDYSERLVEELLNDEMFQDLSIEEIEEIVEFLDLDDLYKD